MTIVWLGQTAPGFIHTACTCLLRTHYLWVDTLLSLDIEGGGWTCPLAMFLILCAVVGGGNEIG